MPISTHLDRKKSTLTALRRFASGWYLFILCSACQSAQPPTRPSPFPATFLWGITTAAYQNEGGIHNDWTEAGIDAGQAAEQRSRFDEDLLQMRQMGIKAYRFSIEWARLEPVQGQWQTQELTRYAHQIQQLRQAGIEPVVTLWHFTQPAWLARQGGWQNPQTIRAYTRYVARVVRRLGPQVRWWMTLNEPMVYALMSYQKGVWPPFHRERSEMERALTHLLSAHAQAYALIHRLDSDALVSLAQSQAGFAPLHGWNPLDRLAAWLYGRAYNDSIWNAIFQTGSTFPFDWSHIPKLANSLDWLAINYYARYFITAAGQPLTEQGEPVTYLNRQADPESFYHILLNAGQYAIPRHLPVMITENGWAQEAERPCYLLEHLASMQRARSQGVPIQGYFHWTLTDNFEWTEGFKVKFGLLDKNRHWKPSAWLYRNLIRQGRISADSCTSGAVKTSAKPVRVPAQTPPRAAPRPK